ncbi:hypothetical protein X734_09750 [Mesorhizobium sp. L2C084A000]|nr:hypothetical protein X734_09750 [Mesorhizobium sp. L2C084A000]
MDKVSAIPLGLPEYLIPDQVSSNTDRLHQGTKIVRNAAPRPYR